MSEYISFIMSEYQCPVCDYTGESFSGFAVHCSLNDDHDESNILREYAIDLIEEFGEPDQKAPTAKTFYKKASVSKNFIHKWFNGYEELVEESYLRNNKITEEDVFKDIQRVNSKVEGTLIQKDYREYGKYSFGSVLYVVGSWNEALRKAGIEVINYRNISKEKLKQEIQRLSEVLDRCPTSRDMEKEGKFAVNTYLRNFGSWNDALVESGFTENANHFKSGEENIMYDVGKKHPLYGKRGEKHPAWGGGTTKSYVGNWYEQRNKAIERAGGVCEHPDCEKEETEYGYDLHCHHIIPNKLTENERIHKLDNLMMVCDEHHREVEIPKRCRLPVEIS